MSHRSWAQTPQGVLVLRVRLQTHVVLLSLTCWPTWRPYPSGYCGIRRAGHVAGCEESLSQFARVAKGVDLRSTAGNCAWVRTPQLTTVSFQTHTAGHWPGGEGPFWNAVLPVLRDSLQMGVRQSLQIRHLWSSGYDVSLTR